MPYPSGLVLEAYPMHEFDHQKASEHVYNFLLTKYNNQKTRRSEYATRKDMKVLYDHGVENNTKSEDGSRGCQERIPTGLACYKECDGIHNIERAPWSSVFVYRTWSLPEWSACLAENCRSRSGVITSEQKAIHRRAPAALGPSQSSKLHVSTP